MINSQKVMSFIEIVANNTQRNNYFYNYQDEI